jgi:hypothetical protein
MAEEIEAAIELILNRPSSSQRLRRKFSRTKFDQTGTNDIHATYSIGFAAQEAIPITDIGTLGLALFMNREAAGGNFVEIGDVPVAAFVPFVKLKPGEFALMRLSDSIVLLSAQADTAAVDLEVWIIED